MAYELNHTETLAPLVEKTIEKETEDYAQLLSQYGLTPSRVDFHLQVGEISRVQGWILHVSVIRTQLAAALHQVIPALISTNTPFRLVKDKETAISVLDSSLGPAYIGKIICIYPESDEKAIELANLLINLSSPYKGPSILTDIHLGGCIYTRYGSFNPVICTDASGNENRFIYDLDGNLVKDIAVMPFAMPEGAGWPFGSIASNQLPSQKKILHDIYKPLENLKTDPRGDVIKAHYLHSWFRVKTCVIKQAKQNMWSDDHGRDMADRLLWQQELYHQLSDTVRMPKILDVFVENGDTYLAMEYIPAKSVFDQLSEKVNPNCEWWEHWPKENQLEALDYLLKIIVILEKLHAAKIVHRDVTPVNFLVDKKKNLVVIDDELAYSIEKKKPYPPFQFGTHGFISPEQAEVRTPTVKEDIYGLGATLITVFVGIPPIVFDTSDPVALHHKLSFFIREEVIVNTIVRCLASDPIERPSLSEMSGVLQQYKDKIHTRNKKAAKVLPDKFDTNQLHSLITGAIKGLVMPPMLIHKDLWQSRLDNSDQNPNKPSRGFGKSGGFFSGMAGILYCVATAKIAGYDISPCLKAYHKNWKYVQETYLKELSTLPPGLAGGAAGIAMAMARGMEAGLIAEDSTSKATLRACLELPYYGLDFTNGLAGQGMVALDCAGFLDESFLTAFLKKNVQIILDAQDKKGNWLMIRTGKQKPATAVSIYQGNTGITLFLLKYYERYKDPAVLNGINKALGAFKKVFASLEHQYTDGCYRGLSKNVQLRDGLKGIILTFIKAYELFKEEEYQDIATELLSKYPFCVVHEDLAQQYGLAGLGDLYLEAYRVFRAEEWRKRADWIAGLFASISYTGEEGGHYWLTNNQTLPTADYLVGNGGIVCFLMRFGTGEGSL